MKKSYEQWESELREAATDLLTLLDDRSPIGLTTKEWIRCHMSQPENMDKLADFMRELAKQPH